MLILLRHGRTTANASGLLLGRLDPPLDEVGIDQAARAAGAIVGAGPIARVITSPLQRARQTAETLGVPVEVDERWIELDYGEWDGRPLGDVDAASWARWRDDVAFAPPGGESLAALSARVVEACAALHRDTTDGDVVVVVSHVSPIKAAVAWALGVGVEVSWRTRIDPASICRVALGGRSPSLHGFNDTGHLD